ncbi:hypothetical protein [Reticulibacter mediterranei]|uniref:hypothetical protein n=1 Tax=Reticulibacter mediterranei TaxID=2778369 RepID=UPI001C688E14|nr:hypothetical protein [Reticulibacter mediterranei]
MGLAFLALLLREAAADKRPLSGIPGGVRPLHGLLQLFWRELHGLPAQAIPN